MVIKVSKIKFLLKYENIEMTREAFKSLLKMTSIRLKNSFKINHWKLDKNLIGEKSTKH